MAKIIITEDQYQRLVLNGFKANIAKLKENEESGKLLIKEGSREFILAAALVLSKAMGKDMSNFNQVIANKAIADPKIMSKIKSTIEDEIKLQDLADEFQNVGMKNSKAILAKNAHKFVDKFNEITKEQNMNYFLDVNAINNLKELNPPKKK